MLIHSDKLTEGTIRDCVPAGTYLAAHYNRNEEWASVHTQGSRSRERAYSVRLSGSSKHTMQNLPDKSATWDEWGEFISALFDIDPKAIIGIYKGRNNFIDSTMNEHERITMYRQDLLPTHSAPWLFR
jgi:hypothetical protein